MVEAPVQQRLIQVEASTLDALVELFPGVWQAAEKIAAPNIQTRNSALDELLQTDALRVSPLIAYLLITRLDDPELDFRRRVITALSSTLQPDLSGKYALDSVRSQIMTALSSLDVSGVTAILAVGIGREEMVAHIATLLNYCPGAGTLLSEIAAHRSNDLSLRRLAIYMIGRVGFVDVRSNLERLHNRIEVKQSSQKGMPFAPAITDDEKKLLPELKRALALLRAS